MTRFAWMLSASVLASAALIAPVGAAEPSTYLISGEILLYSPSESGLPESTMVAPRGVRADRVQLLTVRGISTAQDSGADLSSSALVHGRGELVMGAGSESPLEIGDLSLHNGPDGWAFYASSGDLQGRPVYRFANEADAVKPLDNGDFSLSGEMVLHEAMADELGLRGAQLPPSLVAGAFTLVASRTQGQVAISAPAPAPQQPVVASSALTVPGPDVIVSTIGNTLTRNGASSGITAYSVTTVSCNIGTQDAIWIDCSSGANCNQHPVIGTQFYRFKTVNGATRFEQIGLSWLKHGFCAADASNCGQTPTPNGSCDWLGLWSTDTYSAGLNAQQSNLGPRSEIQPWSGVFPYPYVLGSGTGNPGGIFKRTQVETNDMDPTLNVGAAYMAEVVYICTDEPDGNKYNNYSNRDFVVSGTAGVFNGSFTGTTNREQAAIQRWPLLDTGVTLVSVDVPGDGRFYVGAKATNIGGGLWHYEYAVFNMNSHESARLVQVPADNTVTVTNVGFHDVFYHSGEPYDGTDWGSTKTASNVEWSTSTFATNANANALRWSTTYNFRFDADAPPVSGNLTLGLFRSGGTAVAVGLPVPGSGLPINTPFCFGDGSGAACPCGNNGIIGSGCANSLLNSGTATTSGTASIGADTLAVLCSGMPAGGPALYFQGTAQNGSGVPFGDGLLCVGGAITRLGVVFNNGAGASQYPSGAAPAISVQGLVSVPGVRTYQAWYRDAATGYCTPLTFNLSNGYQVVWTP